MKEQEFKIVFHSNAFKQNDIIESNEVKLLVTSTPKRKWYHVLLQILTFGWFKASWSYTVKPLDQIK